MSRRREYRVAWQREGSPRHSKRFPTRKRAEAYLAAVRAMSPEERYGAKADKPMHPSCVGGYDPPCPKCEGRTWREDWDLRFRGDTGEGLNLKPLLWSNLSSRPMTDWEDEPEAKVEWKFGDVISNTFALAGGRVIKAVVIDDHTAVRLGSGGNLRGVFGYGKHNWGRVDE